MKEKPYSSRMEAPPPVPVTQPSVQNLAQREGMRFAGCSGSSDWTSRSSLVLMAGDYAVLSWMGWDWVVRVLKELVWSVVRNCVRTNVKSFEGVGLPWNKTDPLLGSWVSEP